MLGDFRKDLGLNLECTFLINGQEITVTASDIDEAKEKALAFAAKRESECNKLDQNLAIS